MSKLSESWTLLDRVIVPVDGKEGSEAVLPRVAPLCRAAAGEIVLLQVVPFLESILFMHQDLSRDADRFQADLDPAWKYVDNLARKLRLQGLDARGLAALGPPAPTILEAARAEKATLIAMTTRARGHLSRLAFGSVASKILRHASIPLLLAPASSAPLSPAGTWLFVADDPDDPPAPLRDILRLSHRLGVPLTMLHASKDEEILAALPGIDLVLLAVEGVADRRRIGRLLRKTSTPFLALPATRPAAEGGS